MFTGLYPHRHGATDPRLRLPASITTLAELLAHTYETVAYTSSVYLDPAFGLNKGFEEYDSLSEAEDAPGARETDCGGDPAFAKATDFIAAHRSDGRPLFLFLQAFWVHNYYQDPFDDRERPGDLARYVRNLDWLLGDAARPDEAWPALRRNYSRRVEQMSRDLERLVGALKQAGLWEDTVVAFVSDHGEAFEPELERTHHGGQLHSDVIAIPFLLHVPGREGRGEETPVSLVDVMPTLLDLARVPVPARLDGRSLVPLLDPDHPPAPARTLYAIEHAYWWDHGRRRLLDAPTKQVLSAAAVRGEHWGIRGEGSPAGVAAFEDGEDEIYDMRSDRDQRDRLTDSAEIEAFERSIGDPAHGGGETAPRGSVPAVEEQLKRLGYTR
jgi:arylsulfatase A-like enzyme